MRRFLGVPAHSGPTGITEESAVLDLWEGDHERGEAHSNQHWDHGRMTDSVEDIDETT